MSHEVRNQSTPADEELLALYYRSTPAVQAAMRRLMIEQAKLFSGGGDTRAYRTAEADLADTLTLVLDVAGLLGLRRMALEVDERLASYGLPKRLAASRGWTFEEQAWPPPVPDAPFKEAVSDLLSRQPRLAKGYSEVARIYTQERGFALARSSSRVLTDRVRKEIVKSIDSGAPGREAADMIAEMGDFTEAYASNVYRTNMASAYNLGRFVQAHDPDVDDFVVGFERQSAGDGDVRESHKLADGFIAGKRDPAWLKMYPPGGYQCRCTAVMIDRIQAERRGFRGGKIPPAKIPPGAANDPEFQRSSFRDIGGL